MSSGEDYRLEYAKTDEGATVWGRVQLIGDPETWVHIIIPNARYPMPLQFIVHLSGHSFGFTARVRHDTSTKPIREVATVILGACVRAAGSGDRIAWRISAEPRKFKDLEEQTTVFALLQAAISLFSTKFSTIPEFFETSEEVENAIKSGALIKND